MMLRLVEMTIYLGMPCKRKCLSALEHHLVSVWQREKNVEYLCHTKIFLDRGDGEFDSCRRLFKYSAALSLGKCQKLPQTVYRLTFPYSMRLATFASDIRDERLRIIAIKVLVPNYEESPSQYNLHLGIYSTICAPFLPKCFEDSLFLRGTE